MNSSVLHKELKEYEDWKADHQSAQLCIDLQEIIALGLFLFGRISRLDEQWHAKVFKDEKNYDKQEADSINSLYAMWASPSERICKLIDQMEEKGFEVEGSKEFRKHSNEVRGVLTQDSDFFNPDQLERLEDAAVQEHRAGKCAGGFAD